MVNGNMSVRENLHFSAAAISHDFQTEERESGKGY